MRYYEIMSSDSHLGVYPGASADEALRAMLRDAGAGPDVEPDEDLRAVDVTDEVTELVLGGHREVDLLSAGALPRAREEVEEEGEPRDDDLALDAAMAVAAQRGYQTAALRALLLRALVALGCPGDEDHELRSLITDIERALGAPEEEP